MNRYVRELREDDEPTRRALQMAQAVLLHLSDLAEDDPGDDAASDALIDSAQVHAANLINDLRGLLRKR